VLGTEVAPQHDVWVEQGEQAVEVPASCSRKEGICDGSRTRAIRIRRRNLGARSSPGERGR
jgi:hypothetical protein